MPKSFASTIPAQSASTARRRALTLFDGKRKRRHHYLLARCLGPWCDLSEDPFDQRQALAAQHGPPFAKGGIAGRLAGRMAIDDDRSEHRCHACGCFAIADEPGRRTDAVRVRRPVGDPGREQATALGRDAPAAKHRHFGLNGDLPAQLADLGDRQNPRQHDAADARQFGEEGDGLGTGCAWTERCSRRSRWRVCA